MFKITEKEFKRYKKISDHIYYYLKFRKCVTIGKYFTMLKILSGFPYLLDPEGHFVYKCKFYNSIDDLPDQAKKDLWYRIHSKGNP